MEIEGDCDEWYVRYEIAQGDSPAEAGRACALEDCERKAGSRLLSHGEVAVLVLNGMTISRGKDKAEGDLTLSGDRSGRSRTRRRRCGRLGPRTRCGCWASRRSTRAPTRRRTRSARRSKPGRRVPGFVPKIDVWAVDAYRLHKLKESDDRRRRLIEGRPRTDTLGRPLRPLSAGSINKTIEVLRWLLSFAVEYGWIDDNPAAGKRRRIKIERSPPPHLQSAGQIAAALEAAAELDADPGWLIDDRRPVVATLAFSGLRVHELAALRWGDLDFATLTIHVRHSKTPAGIREVRMVPALRGNLILYRDRLERPGARQLVFRTSRGGPRTKDNVRVRILRPVLARAEKLLEAGGQASLPPGITPHSLRHTFTSLLFAIGEDPVSVMRQLGHTDPAFTLRAYAHSMSRDAGERERLRALADGLAKVGEGDLERSRRTLGTGAEWMASQFGSKPTPAKFFG
jgi:integrase